MKCYVPITRGIYRTGAVSIEGQESVPGRFRKSQLFPASRFSLGLVLFGGGLGGISAFVSIHPLDRVAALLGVHPSAPLRARRIQCQPLCLSHINGKQPARDAAPLA